MKRGKYWKQLDTQLEMINAYSVSICPWGRSMLPIPAPDSAHVTVRRALWPSHGSANKRERPLYIDCVRARSREQWG